MTNVKALFRRAQARKALGKLTEAEKGAFEQAIAHDAVNSVKKSSKAADLASSSTVTVPSSQSSTTTSVTSIPAEPSDSRPLQALRNPKPFFKRPNTFETRSEPTQVASVGGIFCASGNNSIFASRSSKNNSNGSAQVEPEIQITKTHASSNWGSVIQLGTGTTTLLYQYRFPMS
ncbi:hypothetical protein C8R42DRAFT_716875 [Lentinula raphanica]|nr:hypothetical protein C8R42DRAFT_716875 [Lentinula raphanica]